MWRRLARMGFRRGVLGESRPWTVVFVVAGVAHLLSRRAGGEKVLFRRELDGDTTIVITRDPLGPTLPPPTVKLEV
jgi:hypothetical protein